MLFAFVFSLSFYNIDRVSEIYIVHISVFGGVCIHVYIVFMYDVQVSIPLSLFVRGSYFSLFGNGLSTIRCTHIRV